MSWNEFVDSMYTPTGQLINQVTAVVLMVVFVTALTINVGWATMVIVAGSALIGIFCWRAINLRQAITPVRTAVFFLLTVAMLHVHMYEEYKSLFGPAMSRLFNMAFPEERFLAVFVFALPVIYLLTAAGLLLRVPLAAFVAWFIFIGPGTAEFTHFIFPLIPPAIEPASAEVVSAVVNGVQVDGMPNHYYWVTGEYYFPGMYTAVLPMIPGIASIWWLFKNRKKELA